MAMINRPPQPALQYDVEVQKDGHVEFDVPFAAGARIVVFVIQKQDDQFHDLVNASTSSLDFWDNPVDDEDWNNA